VLAEACSAAWLARASYAVVLADARPAAWLARASSAVVLADARPAAWLARVSSAVVLVTHRLLKNSVLRFTFPASFLSSLSLKCVDSIKRINPLLTVIDAAPIPGRHAAWL
jgi:hypothetical protein